jgi:transcription antitermination factor NusG
MKLSSDFWYAVRTKPQMEGRASENLTALGIKVFFPYFTLPKFPFKGPLFPGYIFIHCDLEPIFHKIRFCRGVSFVVSFGGNAAIIPEEVMQEIQRPADAHGTIASRPEISPGDPVVIHSDKLRNLRGIFERRLPGGERVRVLLSTIAYSAHVDVPDFQVAKLPAETPAAVICPAGSHRGGSPLPS